MRQYIRHPSNIPIHYRLGGTATKTELNNIGEGGLCFSANSFIRPGEIITVSIPVSHPPFDAEGIVRWCLLQGDVYLVGVVFNETTVKNSVRMMEQVCYIEHYRTEMRDKQGINLSSEEAAQQWIKKYAADFPGQLD